MDCQFLRTNVCYKEFAEILVDRYLNTPDKGLNETPLHFAVKFGAEEAVDVLTSFPQCNRNAVNRHGEQPKDVSLVNCQNNGPGLSHGDHVARVLAL